MKRYDIRELSQEDFKKQYDNVAFYTKFDNRQYGFDYLVCIEDRKPFYPEKALRSFAKYIRKNFTVLGQLKCVMGINGTLFNCGQSFDYIRYIKV